VLVREPDELGLERAHPQLTLGVRLVERRLLGYVPALLVPAETDAGELVIANLYAGREMDGFGALERAF
jgi:hypothetical protein